MPDLEILFVFSRKKIMKQITQIALFVLSFSFAKAQLTGYSFIRPITVSNTSTATAYGYQLKLTINTQSLISASQMNASGNDLRFGKTCNGSSLFNYWIESGINTSSTVIWVKLDTLLAGSLKTFFMFYGNSSAPAVSGLANVFVGPNSSTDSVASGAAGGVGNSQRGFRFSPNEDLLITALGKREPNGTSRYVTLFDNATQTIVAQTQVAGPAAQYSYGNLAAPFWITQGTQYVLELYQDAADGYYYGASSQVGQHLTYYDMRYCNGCTQNTFPTNVLTNFHYGYPDLWYWTKTNLSPSPSYTMDALPTISVVQSSAAICPLQAVSFTASSSVPLTTYTWQPGNSSGSALNVNPASTTVYSFVASRPACTYTTSGTATITVHPTPTISITGNSPICGTGTRVLTAAGASTYTWNTSVQGATLSVSPTSTTTYSLIGTSALGCTNTAASTVTVNTIPTVVIAGGNLAVCSGSSAVLVASGAASYVWNTTAASTSISVAPSSNTNYTVTGTSAQGCTNTAVTSISVNTTPTVVIAALNPSICSGNSTTLTVSGASSYSWNTSSTSSAIAVSPVTTSNYSVIGTAVSGCTNTAVKTLTVYSTPTVVISSTQNTICSGNTAGLTASGAVSYSWNTTAATASILVSPLTTTNYSVTGTSAEGCTNTAVSTVTVYITPTVSISGGNTTICSGDSVSLNASGAAAFIWNTSQTTSVISVSPPSTAAYTATGISVEGCTNTAVTSVSVNITPTLTISSPAIAICTGDSISLTVSGAATYSWTTGSVNPTITVSPLSTSNYSVTGLSAEGCSNTAVTTMSVFITPTVSISGNTVVCAGNAVTLTAAGATTYSWNTNASSAIFTVIPTTNTSYTAAGVSAEGCIATAVQAVSVNALPVLNTQSSATVICVGETATLSVNGADSYGWNTSETTATIVVSPTTTTVYTVTGTSSVTSCSAVATISQQVSECTGLSAVNASSAELNLYPNPTQGRFVLESDLKGTIIMTNVLGQQVYTGVHAGGKSEINITPFQNGIYLISLESGATILKQKLIKE